MRSQTASPPSSTSIAAAARPPGSRPSRPQGRTLDAVFNDWIDTIAAVPWQAHAGASAVSRPKPRAPLYTPQERERRDKSVWTLVQGILAPLQFAIFAVSLILVLRYLATGEGYAAANTSILLKTAALIAIMVTGSIWEKVVFGKWLFAPAFFWEDVFSLVVIALHGAYVLALVSHWGAPQARMAIAIAAYTAYVINAGQFLWKLREARLEAKAETGPSADQALGRPA